MEQFNDTPVAEPVTENQPCDNASDLKEIRDLLIKQNRIGKCRTIILLVIAIAVVAFCAVGIITVTSFVPKLNASVDSINTAVANVNTVIETLDIDQLNSVIEDTSSIAKEGVSIVEQAKTLLEDLNGIDFNSLNSSIKGLDTTLESVSVVDFNTLNKAIDDLQTAIEPLANLIKKFK